MRATVDQELCTGCGLCPDISPEVFEMEEDIAVVKTEAVPSGAEDDTREAMESCPVEAIELSE